ncbi:MAG: hypothetical protein QW403_01025 [Candidatus Aenigmatarchaeota archaeon]
MKKTIQLFSFLTIFFLLVSLTKAQDQKQDQQFLEKLLDFNFFWKEVLGLPEEWMPTQNIRNFIFNFMIPFLALFTILLGIIKQIRIFWRNRAAEWVVAFAMAFMTLPSRAFITFVQVTLALAGMWGYVMFLAMFFIGSYLYSLLFVRRWGWKADIYRAYKNTIRRLSNEEANLMREEAMLLQELGTPGLSQKEINRIRNRLTEVREQLARIRNQMRQASTVA